MSKIKKALCFVLALAMVFAVAVPAFAADGGDEGIEPYVSYSPCPNCGVLSATSTRTYLYTTDVQHGSHRDVVKVYRVITSCVSCGYYDSRLSNVTDCPAH